MNTTIPIPPSPTAALTPGHNPSLTSRPGPLAASQLTTRSALYHTGLGAVAFHFAWLYPSLASFTLLYAFCLIQLSTHSSARAAFRLGFLSGLLIFAPHFAWFWNIFGFASPCLWSILAFFTGAFVFLLHRFRSRFGTKFLWFAAPILWTGLEYFRSEVYFLKFSWLAVGYAFSEKPGFLIGIGVYGIGFLIFLSAAIIGTLSLKTQKRALLLSIPLLTLLVNIHPPQLITPSLPVLHVAGIQLEFPPALEIPKHLDRLIAQYPGAQVLVLSEYTFDSTIPEQVRAWCRKNKRYLIAGGKDDSVPGNFYNTAFVVDPSGEIAFSQAKSVPIQFFKDGLPAASQEVWNSPWGKIGIPVCYDLSYRQVMDRYIERGAQAIIVPFMDVTDWGAQQHQLHSRIAPVRAAEYGVPIFRLGSSGISQNIDSTGRVLAILPFPGQEQTLEGVLSIPRSASLPMDHWLAPGCSMLAGGFLILLIGHWFVKRLQERNDAVVSMAR